MLDSELLPPSPPASPLSETTSCISDASSPPCIDRLPVELLCRAFCWLPHFDDEDNGVSLNSRTPPWIPVLHVCSSWRTIAMECKELWSWIPLGHPEWTKMALRLSDPVAIALCVTGEHIFANVDESTPVAHYLMKEAFTLALDHLSRVWHLDLEMARPESSNVEDGEDYVAYVRARQILAPLRDAHMNHLTSLRLTRTDFPTESFLEENWASQIRHLTLSSCKMPKSLRLPQLPLVRLALHTPYYDDSFADWLALLGSMKSLEQLFIWDGLKPSHLNDIYLLRCSLASRACQVFPSEGAAADEIAFTHGLLLETL